MSNKKSIGYSPLTDKVYIRRQNKEKRLWVGEKEDITNDFLRVSSEFFSKGDVRTVNVSNGTTSLFIHVERNETDIKKVIKYLQTLLD